MEYQLREFGEGHEQLQNVYGSLGYIFILE
jgi:hypothetical protein